jgi:hypothetical protein
MRDMWTVSPPASSARRALAVFIDFLAYFAAWIAIGFLAPTNSFFYMLGLLLLVDVLGTAYIGVSPGRLLTGIRVVRRTDNRAPGLRPALVRTAIALGTGWLGVWFFLDGVREGSAPQSMWWDNAAGTELVNVGHRAQEAGKTGRPAPKPFNQWSFSATAGTAFGALILCLFSLTNGQAFPMWMLIGLLVAAGAGLLETYAKNTYRDGLTTAMHAPATAAMVLLGVGIILSARPADAVTKAITIADATSSSSRVGGPYYELDATDGTFYSLQEGDFQPSLPKLDEPRFRGDAATLTLDRGTTGVLAIRIDGVDYLTATYTNPTLKLVRGMAIGGLLVVIGAVMAVVYGYFRWVRLALRSR